MSLCYTKNTTLSPASRTLLFGFVRGYTMRIYYADEPQETGLEEKCVSNLI